jgi:DNA-binding IscR family transcriptional regulator
MRAGLVTRTTEHRLLPARDPRRITLCDILEAVRAADRDPHHSPAEEWNPLVQQLGDSVEQAIREAVGARTLAELVADDLRLESALRSDEAPAADPSVVTAPRA